MAHLRCDIKSEVMGMYTSLEVILPDYGKMKDAPVVYLLHGLSGNCSDWSRFTAVERYVAAKGAAIVMPEVQRSFYADMALGIDYFSYVQQELPQICGRLFGLSLRREKNYVMGLSMGGYGALKCALTAPRQYAGCAAFSAAIEMEERIQYAKGRMAREIQAVIGPEGKVPPEMDLAALLKKRKGAQLPRFFITCGEQDALYQENVRFVEALKGRGASVSLEHWAGDHQWEVWDKSVELALEAFLPTGKK
ncbi:MAG: esterase family protein [Oscillospiraceae bacterium]|nr:esterase family protein [Oscillospiraceae bacterium]